MGRMHSYDIMLSKTNGPMQMEIHGEYVDQDGKMKASSQIYE